MALPFDYGWHDLVGNLGVICVLVTYFMLQAGRLSADSLHYGAANALGAILIGISLTVDFNLSSFVIEVFWFGISVFGMVRIARERRRLGVPRRAAKVQ